jgi:hypothetical protein
MLGVSGTAVIGLLMLDAYCHPTNDEAKRTRIIAANGRQLEKTNRHESVRCALQIAVF